MNRLSDHLERNSLVFYIPIGVTIPFQATSNNVAPKDMNRGTAMWSKILPLLLLVWALTGAFYPAIDLCAGEKERGTLETLISSPALRSEIVIGKLLTVMLFSIVTAMLNILSVSLTGWIVSGAMPEISVKTIVVGPG